VRRKLEVPITPVVLDWAIAESGLSLAEVATGVGVDEHDVQAWRSGDVKPAVTELRRLAKNLHRQMAVFLLPNVPASPRLQVQFRHPFGAQRMRELSPGERRFLRRAKRLQDAQAWLVAELGREQPDMPQVSIGADSASVASVWRERLGISVAAQLAWRSASVAFDAWRNAVETLGITAVQFSMGSKACRGFSLWDDSSPLIAVNTAWTDEARSFTLFHEFGHLLTRTDSACASAPVTADAGDSTERWCEAFAAAILIPASALSDVRRVDTLAALSALARRLKTSLRATAVRLIELGKASWSLYDKIPPVSDSKKKGGGGTGRNRREIREDEFGRRTTEMFVSAVRRDIISESQALDYLDIPSSEFERLTAVVS
jgi:Zn-dependent peptidase ImmA (M78 family)